MITAIKQFFGFSNNDVVPYIPEHAQPVAWKSLKIGEVFLWCEETPCIFCKVSKTDYIVLDASSSIFYHCLGNTYPDGPGFSELNFRLPQEVQKLYRCD